MDRGVVGLPVMNEQARERRDVHSPNGSEDGERGDLAGEGPCAREQIAEAGQGREGDNGDQTTEGTPDDRWERLTVPGGEAV